MMRKAIFLGGAPKCGTSAFFDLLSSTGFFEPSHPKETFYFIDPDYPVLNKKYNYWKQGTDGFYSFFNESPDSRLLLEGSTHLLYQKEIPKILAGQDAKFIFILREPASRIRSSFEYTKNNLAYFSKDISFSDYVRLLLTGQAEELNVYIKSSVSRSIIKNELNLSNYGQYLQNWYAEADDRNIHIILYENMLRDPSKEAIKVLEWLNLNIPEKAFSLQTKNQTRAIRNKRLHRLLSPINKIVPSGKIKNLAKQLYFRTQSGERETDIEYVAALQELKAYFQPANEHLALKYNLDLQLWK